MTQFAFVFPGQGSQTVGMLSEMAARYPVIEETFREASDALGYDLWALTQQGPAEELNKTWQTQPALLTASVALWRVWQHRRCWNRLWVGAFRHGCKGCDSTVEQPRRLLLRVCDPGNDTEAKCQRAGSQAMRKRSTDRHARNSPDSD